MKKHLWVISILLMISCLFTGRPALCQVRIMPLGDSITRGDFSGEPDEGRQTGYRLELWNRLRQNGYDVDFVGSLSSGFLNAGFDSGHEGHSGWTAYEILNGRLQDPQAGNLASWLNTHRPDIVLLHIGTNGLEDSPNGVGGILDAIFAYNPNTWVVLALIINRACCLSAQICPECQVTAAFNNNVEMMALSRINTLGARIVVVDMEIGAGIDYRLQPIGDMWDDLHPFNSGAGYGKMASAWFGALSPLLSGSGNGGNAGGGGGTIDAGSGGGDTAGSGGGDTGGGGGGGCFLSLSGAR